jgi:hypothetical protein
MYGYCEARGREARNYNTFWRLNLIAPTDRSWLLAASKSFTENNIDATQ